MFGKLLKYDFTHYLKLWVIGAATTLVMSLIGGFCLNNISYLYNNEKYFLVMMFTFAIIVSVICFAGFAILSTVLICLRYAKNCFSDEAYLTFTLPVKRSTVFNSKLFNGILYYLMTIIVEILCMYLFLRIGVPGFYYDFNIQLHYLLTVSANLLENYYFAYFAVILILIVLSILFNITIIYFCVTIAGTKFKKNKVLAGIGIYYLVSIITGVVGQVGMIISTYVLYDYVNRASALIFIAIIAVWMFAVIAALYYWQLNMLDKKLNLA